MMEQEKISEDLFKKIRSRFPDVVIGDADGNVTNMPKAAKFFDFDYKGLGKVSISLDEDGFSVIYSKDFISNEDELTKKEWYDFLKELRVFSKKRMLDFVRDRAAQRDALEARVAHQEQEQIDLGTIQ